MPPSDHVARDAHDPLTGVASPLVTALAERYRVERELGAGGMATVWLAEDLRHHRKVAIKVLHPELSAILGPERFLKEIELTANLQHPHILPLFDSGSADGQLYYVMPYVEGETLRARLERERQLPVADALRIATEVADALQYAHERGVVHRDIKPENILLQGDHALVADFGIALAVQSAGGERMTQTGLSLGTPQYMAPEQAMGERSIGARVDVYALGAVLYEMLAGEPPFTGPSAQAIVARIMTEPPRPLAAQRATVSPEIDAAVLTALAKVPADRFGSAAAFAAALAGGAPNALPPGAHAHGSARSLALTTLPALRRWRIAAIAGFALAFAAVAAAGWAWRRTTAASNADVIRFRVETARRGDVDEPRRATLSRDGRMLLLQVQDADSGALAVRRLDHADAVVVQGTAGAYVQTFSPDGASIAFITAGGDVRVVPVAGGQPITLSRDADGNGDIAWGDDGYLYFTSRARLTIERVSARGGSAEVLGTLDSSSAAIGFRSQRNAVLTPSGRGVLYGIFRGPGIDGDIGVVDLRTRGSRLIAKGRMPLGVAWGHLLVVSKDGELRAFPFDEKRLAVTGPPTTLLANIELGESTGQISLAANGTIAYSSDVAPDAQLVWVDRTGVETPVDPALKRPFDAVAISPTGDRVAVSMLAGGGGGSVWVYSLAERTITRFSAGGTLDYRPAWTPDGASIVFASDRGDARRVRSLWIAPADGSDSARLFVASPTLGGNPLHVQEVSWSPGSPLVVYRIGYDDGKHYRDLRWFRPGADTTTHAAVATAADELNPALSPDGRWLAYISNESGRDEVYVRPFPGPGGRVQVSLAGGVGPIWAHSGRELFYRAADGRMTAVTVAPSGGRFGFGDRRPLFSTSPYRAERQHRPYDLAPDDRHFLLIRSPQSVGVEVVVNWGDEARRLLGRAP